MKDGKDTSEYGLAKLLTKGNIGLIIACLAAVLPIIIKTLPENSTVAIVAASLFAVVTTVSTYVTGKVGAAYVDGRSAIKIEEVASKAVDPSVP